MGNVVNNFPEWNDSGREPEQTRKDSGWNPKDKPPADFVNWFWYTVYQNLLTIDSQFNASGQTDAVTYKTNDIDSDGDGKVDNAASVNNISFSVIDSGSFTLNGGGGSNDILIDSIGDKVFPIVDIKTIGNTSPEDCLVNIKWYSETTAGPSVQRYIRFVNEGTDDASVSYSLIKI